MKGAALQPEPASGTRSLPPPTTSQPANGPARGLIDGSVLFFVVLAAAGMALVATLKGGDALARAVTAGLGLALSVSPMIAVGLFLGGLTRELADPAKVAPVLGERSGLRGLLLATALGAITPGGPFAAFPIVYALFLAGADVGAVIAYLTAWAVLALHRVVVWELPLLGPEFAAVRVLASLPLPVLAGWLARLIAVGPLAIARPLRHDPSGAGKQE
jgi:uncharacterized membrane protein YraQ (UPF0718 family)